MLYLGRGTSFAVALEGALKLKEISYIHAEAYAAGELKHGPIALIDESVPVIVVAPRDHLFEKTASNLQEIVARGGRVVLLSDAEGVAELGDYAWQSVILPTVDPFVAPILYAVPVQLLAYHTAVLKGTDVDQPRNLAKSVTVEEPAPPRHLVDQPRSWTASGRPWQSQTTLCGKAAHLSAGGRGGEEGRTGDTDEEEGGCRAARCGRAHRGTAPPPA